MKNRIFRINDEIAREVANIIRSEIKDPRVSSMTTVLRAETSTDLKHCKVFVSIMGEEDLKKEVLEGLKSASGFIKKMVAERIDLRQTPDIKFVNDGSLEEGLRISKLIDEVNASLPKPTEEE